MKEIDWSKAPEGAIGAFTKCNSETFFVKTKLPSQYMSEPGFEGIDGDGREYRVFTEYWAWVERAWTGEGLPPVGTVCEVRSDEGLWVVCTVLAHNEKDAVFVDATGVYGGLDELHRFRPIRTPEQIAAEEREKAIQKMVSCAGGRMSFRSICESLYDHGYRKQDKEK